MTKREEQRQITGNVIELLEKGFGATGFDDEGHGLFTFQVGDLTFQLSRRDFEVLGFDSTPLRGEGFSEEMVNRHIESVRLENQMQSAIEDFFTK